jgi:spore germination protein YaaH/peptidoglycan hydrolase-like protein with peptidoglycan-binding domain
MPYWREEKSIESAMKNISSLNEINPFTYTVKTDGTVVNNVSFSDKKWRALRAKAKENRVKFIPTIMWAGKETIYNVLSNAEKRKAHIQSIAQQVYGNNLDGIDIDYESKSAETRLYFSLFLKELRDAIGYNRDIVCTIEPRMPVEDRYSKGAKIPTFIEYANDFSQINQYCDRVRIMAYDQGRADLTLNEEREHPYAPVADTYWVEKVIRLAAEEIDPSKLSIGVATYGYEYDMFKKNGRTEYSRLWSFNPGYATTTAEKVGVKPVRSISGELTLTFPASLSPEEIPLPNATRVLFWSDSGAVEEKVKLAKKLGVQGVAIFKIDGGEDEGIWKVLAGRENITDVVAEPLPEVKAVEIEATTPFVPKALISVPSANLEEGDINENVRTLQKLLNQAGYIVSESGAGSPGNETSIFGPATKGALIKYQKAHNLYPPIGYYGPLTRESMGSTALVTELSRDLELGDIGEDVRILQSILNKEGFVIAPSGLGSPGAETNFFGAKTKEAVIKYQLAKGLTPAVGYVGPKTRASLLGR